MPKSAAKKSIKSGKALTARWENNCYHADFSENVICGFCGGHYFRCVPQKTEKSPLLLLIRVNALHSWRRLLAIRQQSRLLTGIITSFIAGYLLLSFWMFFYGMKFIAKFPG